MVEPVSDPVRVFLRNGEYHGDAGGGKAPSPAAPDPIAEQYGENTARMVAAFRQYSQGQTGCTATADAAGCAKAAAAVVVVAVGIPACVAGGCEAAAGYGVYLICTRAGVWVLTSGGPAVIAALSGQDPAPELPKIGPGSAGSLAKKAAGGVTRQGVKSVHSGVVVTCGVV